MTMVKFAYTAVVTVMLGIHSPALGEGATAPSGFRHHPNHDGADQSGCRATSGNFAQAATRHDQSDSTWLGELRHWCRLVAGRAPAGQLQ
jgi:hypothetical protein